MGYFENKLSEVPKEIIERAVKFLQSEIEDDLKEKIREEINNKGLNDWLNDYHMYWGMGIRNLLRTEAGLKDDMLPDGNWDDYYGQCIEIAVGKREYDFV